MTRRVSRWYDRPFSGASLTVGVGPLDPPDIADIRRVLAEVIRAAPGGPAAVEIRAGLAVVREHVDAEALAVAMVVPAGALPAADDVASALAERCGQRIGLDGLPFRMSVGPDYAILNVEHVVGDASVANALVTGLLLAARGGDLPSILLVPTTARVTRAVIGTLLRTARPMPRCHPVELPTVAGGVWLPTAGVAHASYPDAALRRLKVESRRLGVRRSSLLIALFEEALARQGLAPADDVRTVVVDCRRYLPTGGTVRGNFSSGEALRASWQDAAEVDAVTTLSLERARPLLHLALGSLLSWLPGRPVRPVAPGVAVRVHPDYSVVGRLRGAAGLAWTDRPNFVCATHPYRPDAVGVISCEVGSTLQVSVGYDRALVDGAAIDEVLRTLGDLMADL